MAYFQSTKSGRVRAQVYVRGVRKSMSLPDMPSAQAWATKVESQALIKYAMKEAADNRFLLSGVPRRVLQAMADIPFTKEEVLAGSIGVPQRHGGCA